MSGRGFSFDGTIQPILNKHCIQCHDGTKTHEGDKALPDLTDRVVTGGRALRAWPASYLTLTGTTLNGASAGQAGRKALNWISTQSRPSMLPPYHAGSAKSQIVATLRNGHGETTLSREELDKVCAWIDLAVPLCGDYVERNIWSNAQFERYIRYQRKRERLATEVRRNTEALSETQTGKPLKIEDPKPRYLNDVAARRHEQ